IVRGHEAHPSTIHGCFLAVLRLGQESEIAGEKTLKSETAVRASPNRISVDLHGPGDQDRRICNRVSLRVQNTAAQGGPGGHLENSLYRVPSGDLQRGSLLRVMIAALLVALLFERSPVLALTHPGDAKHASAGSGGVVVHALLRIQSHEHAF